MDLETRKVEISLTQYEAAGLIEAVHDSLFRKVRWSISPGYENWHNLDFQIVKASVDSLSSAYMQLYMAFRQSIDDLDGAAIDPEFEKAFIITDEAWAVIDQVRFANSWDEVEVHKHSETLCRACRELNRTPKA